MKGLIVEVYPHLSSATHHQLVMINIGDEGYCVAQVKSMHQLNQSDWIEGDFIVGATSKFTHTHSYPYQGSQDVLLEIIHISSESECRDIVLHDLPRST